MHYTNQQSLMNRDLQFCTIHGALAVRPLAAILLVSDRQQQTRLTETFPLTG